MKDFNELEETIKNEIEEFKKQSNLEGDMAYCSYFNNFPMYLPGCGGKEQTQLLDGMDSPLKDSKYKTYREFYQDIEELVIKCEIDTGKVNQLQIKSLEGDISKRKELLELTLPIYIGMIHRGYTKTDLTS